jgi:four helix bundle protein
MDANGLKSRTFEFGQRVIRVVRSLPKTVEAKAVGSQLVRCGTAVGANYRATCKSRSRAEFIAKIGVVEEEADEAAYWLETIVASEMLKSVLIQPLLQEAGELERIFGKSRVTARQKQRIKVPNRN